MVATEQQTIRAPVLAAPAVEGLLGHPNPAGGLSHCAAVGYRHLGLSQLVGHLLRRMSIPSHLSPFLRPNTNIIPEPALGGRPPVNVFFALMYDSD